MLSLCQLFLCSNAIIFLIIDIEETNRATGVFHADLPSASQGMKGRRKTLDSRLKMSGMTVRGIVEYSRVWA